MITNELLLTTAPAEQGPVSAEGHTPAGLRVPEKRDGKRDSGMKHFSRTINMRCWCAGHPWNAECGSQAGGPRSRDVPSDPRTVDYKNPSADMEELDPQFW